MAESTEKRTALVTGAGRGIGQGIALQLARDGYNVAINDIPSQENQAMQVLKQIEEIGARGSLHLADVSDEEQVKRMIDEVVKEHGLLDVMVANAGVVILKSVFDTSVEDLDKLMSVNVKGTFLCYKYAGKQMIAQGKGGRIIGASSVTGKQAMEMFSVYSASKFAIRGLTQAFARELGPHKITVNAYAPGTILTDMIDYVERVTGAEPGAVKAKMATLTCVGYNGTPAEIASLVSYLASKEAHFITGQSVSCNGGMFFD
ncbi:acetoin reductase family protein [Moniliophthora roreri MCA 2997]|uniref:Acetoin reductase family protein n=1 Tax=Moniliophthora roreri (strain MCA 2997) TaxID=1381753 RepID=V2YNW2_MONRO|nr:acetoin reductase family protein [Moniliophthora roreri MCA 2997]